MRFNITCNQHVWAHGSMQQNNSKQYTYLCLSIKPIAQTYSLIYGQNLLVDLLKE